MARFRKKPVVIEAVRVLDVFTRGVPWPAWLMTAVETGVIRAHGSATDARATDCYVTISTAEGVMRGDVTDWIIRGVKGELYPCKPDIFEATYEPEEST